MVELSSPKPHRIMTLSIIPDNNGTVSALDACHHVWQSTESADIMVAFALGEWRDILENSERVDLGELNAWIGEMLSF